jgi:hypothetical protein
MFGEHGVALVLSLPALDGRCSHHFYTRRRMRIKVIGADVMEEDGVVHIHLLAEQDQPVVEVELVPLEEIDEAAHSNMPNWVRDYAD